MKERWWSKVPFEVFNTQGSYVHNLMQREDKQQDNAQDNNAAQPKGEAVVTRTAENDAHQELAVELAI